MPFPQTLSQMNYYTYTIRFVDGYYYHGMAKYRGENPLFDGYYGSAVTHKEKWQTTMYWKEIISGFDSFEECCLAERSLIKPVYMDDPYCLNENCAGSISLSACSTGGKTITPAKLDSMRKTGSQVGKDNVRLERGFWKPGMKEVRAAAIQVLIAEQKGIFSREAQSKAGLSCKEKKKGIFDPQNKEKCKQGSIKSGKKQGPLAAAKLMEEGRGIHDPELQVFRKDWSSRGGKVGGKKGAEAVNKLKFMNTDNRFPPHVSTPAGLTNWQKARGIDVSNRVLVN